MEVVPQCLRLGPALRIAGSLFKAVGFGQATVCHNFLNSDRSHRYLGVQRVNFFFVLSGISVLAFELCR